jgi:uncharacterized protein YacL
MNLTHIHLLITHLPIIGSLLGSFVLAYGLWSKSYNTKIAAYFLFIFCSIGAGIAYLTGEAAEQTVENMQGVVKATIKIHEEFALFALLSLIILGIASLLGLFLTLIKSPIAKSTAFVILFISFISFGLVSRTGYLGGQIRHTELNATTDNHSILNAKDDEKE